MVWRRDELVGADAGCLERFRRQLLVLVGDHVHAERELVDVGAFAAEVEDADLGVGHAAVEAGFGVWLWGKWVLVRINNNFIASFIKLQSWARERFGIYSSKQDNLMELSLRIVRRGLTLFLQ